MPDDITEWRRAERARLVEQRLAAGSARRRRWSASIAEHLRRGFTSLAGATIGVYSPFRGEPDVRSAIDHWRTAGATTALPAVVTRGAPLQFRAFWPGVRMRKDLVGLPCPQGTPVVTPQVLLLPMVGFDAHGFRLGYGGGYFDRTLAALAPQPLKIGIAFELSRIPPIRPRSHDVPMDFIVTEAGIHAVAAGLDVVADCDPEAITRQVLGKRRGPVPAPAPVGGGDIRPYASPPCYAHELDPDY